MYRVELLVQFNIRYDIDICFNKQQKFYSLPE